MVTLLRGHKTSNNETVSHCFDLRPGNIAKSMTSEGNSELLPANVDRRPPLQRGFIMNFQLQISFGKQLVLFPSNLNVSLDTTH